VITVSDLAQLARNIAGPLADETRLRCAIGRAYYSAFHNCDQAANKWCGDLTPVERDKYKGAHIQLYFRLENHNSSDKQMDAELSFLAEEAKKLRNLRASADYELTETIIRRDVDRSFAYMQNVQDSFNKLSTLSASIK